MTHDSINNPSHYAAGRQHEPIAVIEDWELGYRLGNAVKYISRAGRKQNALEDLKKAQWYLAREIESLEPSVPFAVTYEDVLQDQVNAASSDVDLLYEYGLSDVDDQELSYWEETDNRAATIKRLSDNAIRGYDLPEENISYDVNDADWQDFWVGGWDDSVGPVEVSLSQEEIKDVMSRKDLNSFQTNEIIATIEKREMIIGVRKDGSTCVLKDGRCE